MIQRHVINTYSQMLGRQFSASCNITSKSMGQSRITPYTQLTNCRIPIGTTRKFMNSSVKRTEAAVVVPMLSSKDLTDTKHRNVSSPSDSMEDRIPVEGPPTVATKEDVISQKTSNRKVPSTFLEKRIKEAENVDAILDLTKGPFGIKVACQILHSLGQLVKGGKAKNLDLATLEKDIRFTKICNLVRKSNYANYPPLLLVALEGLESMGYTPKNDLIRELENELKWIMRRCPVRFISRVIYVMTTGRLDIVEGEGLGMSFNTKVAVANMDKLDSGHPLFTAIQTLQRRWVEITAGSDFISTFRIINHLSAETREKLEDRAVELVQDFTVLEMIKIFIALAQQKRRPTPLLRSLAFHVSKSTEKIPAKDLIELVYALNELTFGDPVLMEKVCNDLRADIPSIENPVSISSLATSLGQMRYYHKDLVNALGEWLEKHTSQLRPFDCAAWLLASAVLNLEAPVYPQLFEKIKTVLTQQTVGNPIEWLNIVHAMSVLNQSSVDLVATVLAPEFVSKIDSNEKCIPSRFKLLNLNAMAGMSTSFGLGNYTGPFISKDVVLKWTDLLSANDVKLSKLVIDSLSNFLPPPKYLSTAVKSETGVFIDSVCLINEKLDPLPVTTSEVKVKKVAIVVQGYPVFTLGQKVPTGSSRLNNRLLEAEGYHVISVPYTEFSAKEKLVRRVQYLEQRLRNIEIYSRNSTGQEGQSNSRTNEFSNR